MSYQPYQSTWQNPYLPNQPMTVQPYQQPVNGITKVNGRDSALQYPLPPNSMSQPLFDNNGKTFYIVSTDGAGGKTVEAFDFAPHVDSQPAQPVSREEFDSLADKVNAALGAINELHATVPEPSAKPASSAKRHGTRKPKSSS